MSEMTANGASDDTLIRDSQLSGFSSFKERLGACCCRLFKKSSNYDLSSASKNIEEQQVDKPSYINQSFQQEKQARQEKLEKIAKTLPGGTGGIRTPNAFNSVTNTPTRSIRPTQGTPQSLTQKTARSGIVLAQNRPPIGTPSSITANKPSPLSKPVNKPSPLSKPVNKPSPLAKNNKKDSDETVTEDSSEEESSSSSDNSSDDDVKPAKPPPNHRGKKPR